MIATFLISYLFISLGDISAGPVRQGTNHLRLGYNCFPHLALMCPTAATQCTFSNHLTRLHLTACTAKPLGL
eukprot:c15962_g1_i2 orf=1-213(-)